MFYIFYSNFVDPLFLKIKKKSKHLLNIYYVLFNIKSDVVYLLLIYFWTRRFRITFIFFTFIPATRRPRWLHRSSSFWTKKQTSSLHHTLSFTSASSSSSCTLSSPRSYLVFTIRLFRSRIYPVPYSSAAYGIPSRKSWDVYKQTKKKIKTLRKQTELNETTFRKNISIVSRVV